MRSAITVALIAGAVILTGAPTAARPAITAGDLRFELSVTEGVEHTPVQMQWRQGPAGWLGEEADGLAAEMGPETGAEGRMGVLRVVLRNLGDERRLAEVTLGAEVALDDDSAIYWDGAFRAVHPIPGEQFPGEQRPRGSWPLSALGDATRALLMGVTPDTLISYAEPALNYVPGGASRYSFAVRVVLDPGQEQAFGLCAGTVRYAQYGFLPAVWQAYREAFPATFEVGDDVADAIWGTSAQYHSWGRGEVDRERLRRLGCTWDWCYAPFKRAGDMWGRDEEWEFEPLAKSYTERRRVVVGQDMGEVTAEQFREARADWFAEYGLDCGHLFYTPSGIWVEKQLAQQEFADAIVVNDELATELSQWVTGNDTELLVQPTGTSYAERLCEDYALIAENLDVTGFAFDVCVAGQRNYSDAVEQPLPGRSWDERGVFFDLGISMVEQMRYIRGLSAERLPFGERPIVGAGSSFTTWHVDGALLELTLTGAQRDRWPLMCMALGGKPGVIWKGWEINALVQDVDALSRADYLRVLANLADHVHLKSFQWGMFPGYNYLPGMDEMQRDMPLLRELVRAGWQALCPVTTTPGGTVLWNGRYGRGAGTYLALCNPNEEAVTAQVTVDNEPLGRADCVFVDRRNPSEPLAQTIAGRRTRLAIDLPRREPTVLRSVLALRCDQALECVASVAKDLDHVTTTVRVTAPEAGAASLEVPARRGFAVEGVAVNGAPIADVAAVALRAGENAIEITYRSEHFALTQARLETFGWLTEAGEMGFVVVAAKPERRDYRRVIGRLDRYFRYYARHELDHEAAPLIVETEAAGTGAEHRVELHIGDGTKGNGWSSADDGRTLVLAAPDEREAIRRTEELLAALDRRFEHTVPFLPVYGITAQTLARRELDGKTMTEALAEEGLAP